MRIKFNFMFCLNVSSLCFLSLAVLFSCESEQGQTEKRKALLEQGLLERRLQKVTDAELLFQAKEMMDGLVQKCPKTKIFLCDSLLETKALNHYYIAKENVKGVVQKQYMEAFEYAFEHGQPLDNVCQSIGDKFIYMVPIANDSVFLGTHIVDLPKKVILMHM